MSTAVTKPWESECYQFWAGSGTQLFGAVCMHHRLCVSSRVGRVLRFTSPDAPATFTAGGPKTCCSVGYCRLQLELGTNLVKQTFWSEKLG